MPTSCPAAVIRARTVTPTAWPSRYVKVGSSEPSSPESAPLLLLIRPRSMRGGSSRPSNGLASGSGCQPPRARRSGTASHLSCTTAEPSGRTSRMMPCKLRSTVPCRRYGRGFNIPHNVEFSCGRSLFGGHHFLEFCLRHVPSCSSPPPSPPRAPLLPPPEGPALGDEGVLTLVACSKTFHVSAPTRPRACKAERPGPGEGCRTSVV
mmetsp:Transcript_53133/g.172773  ORF Transcript_53133/g.172773 Transcript_53133/m.172773 type:complete len:207 (+) Transcript_53133:1517-2137(+)